MSSDTARTPALLNALSWPGRALRARLPTTHAAAQRPLDVDDALTLLQNERRRRTVRYLDELDEGDGLNLGTLAGWLAAIETGAASPEEVTAAERKRAYVGLYQCHLPELAEAGVISFVDSPEFNRSGTRIERGGPAFDQLARLLSEIDRHADEATTRPVERDSV